MLLKQFIRPAFYTKTIKRTITLVFSSRKRRELILSQSLHMLHYIVLVHPNPYSMAISNWIFNIRTNAKTHFNENMIKGVCLLLCVSWKKFDAFSANKASVEVKVYEVVVSW